ncbi:flavodoxin [Umezawaea sp. Da 62-37]|uniref:flavodoxin family protein n=1 Tax=Umezawaea sp. Da 62-37 TaxID=3075927 RepID=UPI0028F6C35B|nr:flavodoxin [Umezawaea sp. Da 62-37]WNV87463.1 flavodoxin [Umezawaea sp. Da 62-37]
MTRALVVYESMFGNTRLIARAVAEGLSTSAAVDLVEVGAAAPLPLDDVDLLVVGAPTHAFGMSRPSTRESASDQAVGEVVSTGIGLREWLDGLDNRHPTARVAAFDTRMKAALLSGSAARRALSELRRLGFQAAARPESFGVTGTRGPLRDGEIDRARQWGVRIAAEHAARYHVT